MPKSNVAESPVQLIKRLYPDVDPLYDLPAQEERAVKRSKSSSLYGEITPSAAKQLFGYLELKPRDVFYDLGSGVGKVVMQAALSTKARKVVGVELARSRYKLAEQVRKQAVKEGLIRADKAEFRCEDLMKTDLSDATFIYTCSTAFPPAFMRRLTRHLATLRKDLIFISLQDVDDTPFFEHIDTLRLDMTWKPDTPVHVYWLTNPRQAK